MSNGVLSIDVFLHDAVLIDSDSGKYIKHALVHRFQTVDNKGDCDLLPSRTTLFGVFPPEL
jgi:hypothetical protein